MQSDIFSNEENVVINIHLRNQNSLALSVIRISISVIRNSPAILIEERNQALSALIISGSGVQIEVQRAWIQPGVDVVVPFQKNCDLIWRQSWDELNVNCLVVSQVFIQISAVDLVSGLSGNDRVHNRGQSRGGRVGLHVQELDLSVGVGRADEPGLNVVQEICVLRLLAHCCAGGGRDLAVRVDLVGQFVCVVDSAVEDLNGGAGELLMCEGVGNRDCHVDPGDVGLGQVSVVFFGGFVGFVGFLMVDLVLNCLFGSQVGLERGWLRDQLVWVCG